MQMFGLPDRGIQYNISICIFAYLAATETAIWPNAI